jgi:hypothetical protein
MPRCRYATCRSAASSWPKPRNNVRRKSAAYSATFNLQQNRRRTLCLAAPDSPGSRQSQRCVRRQVRHSLAPSMALASRAKKAAVPTAIWTQYSMIGRSQVLAWSIGCQMVEAKGRGRRAQRRRIWNLQGLNGLADAQGRRRWSCTTRAIAFGIRIILRFAARPAVNRQDAKTPRRREKRGSGDLGGSTGHQDRI